ncbi:MAG: hydrogen peroxide-inducible genes activator [Planktomarina sp.]
MKNLTLKQMRYFTVVMDELHIGRAADRCAVSQPALSVQIKEMEKDLSAQLFERGPKGVQPTRFAVAMLPKVTGILKSVDALGDVSPTLADGSLRQFALGVIPTVAPYFLPRVLGTLTADFPTLDLQVAEALTPKLLSDLTKGQLDAAILALPLADPDLEAVALFAEDFVLVRPAADAGKPIPPAAILAREKLLLLEEGHCFRDQALEFCGLQNAYARPGLDACNLSTLVQLVASGLGVTLIPEMAIDVETRGADVAVSHFIAPKPGRTIGIVWRKANPLADHFPAIANALQAMC